MSSWACQAGGWNGSPSPCATTPGATFSVPITLNIFGVGPATSNGPSTVGSLLATDTQTFNIPYRPSADPIDCPSPPPSGMTLDWERVSTDTLPTSGSPSGTSIFPPVSSTGSLSTPTPPGYIPSGNEYPRLIERGDVARASAPSVGSDPYPERYTGTIIGNGYQSNYCDGGAAGLNVFRIDEPTGYPSNNGTNSGCWSVSGTAEHRGTCPPCSSMP